MPGSKPGERRGGRQKGTPNKFTGTLKDMILKALEKADEGGAVAYLTKQANANPTAFMTLLGKVLPMQVTGQDGGPLIIYRVSWATDEKARDNETLLTTGVPRPESSIVNGARDRGGPPLIEHEPARQVPTPVPAPSIAVANYASAPEPPAPSFENPPAGKAEMCSRIYTVPAGR